MIEFLGASALGAAGCGLIRRRPEARLLASHIQPPHPFKVALPMPPVLKPVKISAVTDFYEMAVYPAEVEILPGVKTKIWGYEGSFPGPTIEASRGRQIDLLQKNLLPVPIVTHLHGGCTPPESDGYPTDLILPEAGSLMAHMNDPLAKIAKGQRSYIFPNEQRAATLWYHDHRMDFTGPQVWRGLAGFYLIRDDGEDALSLPKGEKDIPLMICDRSFAEDGSFRYPALDPSLIEKAGVEDDYMGGVLGDVILVNGAPWPNLEVANTRYRFRLLNASNARRYELRLDPPDADGTSFIQIASDGGLLPAPISRRSIRIAPAERSEVIIDFSKYPLGSTVVLRNDADEGPTSNIMQFRVTRSEKDESAVPVKLSDIPRLDPAAAAVKRNFHFSDGRVHGRSGWTINGHPFDPTRMDAQPKLDEIEIWQLTTDIGHPVHLHLVHFQVISDPEMGWKDTVDLVPGRTVKIIMRFSGFKGRYVFHCHNLEHEDMAMMGNFEVA